ncbi:MAG: hypothetical protein QOG98_833, partial [Pseudonocardiales bacterium]|nr:hypothetical protein [Pseudonocardiales bacterium]
PRPPPAGCPAGGALTRAAAGLGGGETAGAADPRDVADARGSARGAEAPGAAGAPGAAEALGAAEAPGALGAAEAPGAAGAARPENDLRTDSAGLAARRCADRAVVAAAVSLAWSCWVSIGPAPVTASIRRTGATVDTKLSTMPPGVQDCCFGTRRTARGRPRLGRSCGVNCAAGERRTAVSGAGAAAGSASAGVHQRGGCTPASRKEFTRATPGPFSARRIDGGRAVPAAKRAEDDARLPTWAGRSCPSGGPGRRIRRTTACPSRHSSAGSAAVTAWPGSWT